MWKCGSKSAVHCKILRYNIAKTTSQKSCNSLPSQKLYTITCIIPLFTSRLAAKVKKKETWMVCSLHIQTAMYFQFKTLKVWISLKTMENMASTGAIALSTVTPAPGSHSAALPVGIQGPLQCSLPSVAPAGPKLLCQAGAKYTIRHPSFPSSPFWSLANSVRYDRFLFAKPASRLEIDISVSLLYPLYLTACLPMISPCQLTARCFNQFMHWLRTYCVQRGWEFALWRWASLLLTLTGQLMGQDLFLVT